MVRYSLSKFTIRFETGNKSIQIIYHLIDFNEPSLTMSLTMLSFLLYFLPIVK